MPHQLQSFFTKKTNVRAVTILLSILIVITGFFNYRHEHRTIHRTQEHFLQSVAHLKANQISAWYKDEIHDAEIIANDFFLLEYVQKWLADPSSVNRQWLLRYLTAIRDVNDYTDVLLTTAEGRLLLALDHEITQLDSSLILNIRRAVATDSLIVTDFYRCPVHQKIRLDIIRPLIGGSNSDVVLIFKLDPETFLFPMVQTWPVPSKSAETLIVRQEGDSVLFMNELRHLRDTALNLKVSLKELNVPAVQAVRGYHGIWSGLDYRGVKVLADVRPISGTPWFMVAKIDRSELFTELRSKAFYMVLFVFLLVLFVAVGLGLLYYLKQRDVYRQLYRSQQEFRTTLYSIGDAVITTDIRGKIKYLNPVAEELTGWRERQVVGKPLRRVFKIINEDTRQSVESPMERVLKEGLVVGLANHTLLIAKDGREVPIADSGAPIRDEEGNIIGVVLVFRDQTAERAARRALEESEERYRLIVEKSHDGIEICQDDRIIFCNARFAEILGYTPAEIHNIPFSQIFTEEALRDLDDRRAQREAGQLLPHFYETTFYRKDRSVINVQVSYEIIHYRGKPATFATIRDITAQKQAQMEYQQLINGMNDTAFVISYEGKFIEVNEAAVRTLGYSREELLNMSPTDIDPHLSAAEIGRLIDGMKSDRRQVFETQHRAKDGHIIPVEINSSQVMYKGGKAILSICRDITERKKAEEALKKSEALLKVTGNIAKVGGWELDVQTKKVSWTEETYRIHEVPLDYEPSLEEAISFFHPEDRGTLTKAIECALERGEPYDFQLRFITGKGKELWTRAVCEPEIVDGKVVKLKGIFQDITARKKAEDELKKQYSLLQIAGKTARFGGWDVDLRTNTCTWSDAVADIHEVPHGFAPKVEEGINFYTPEWREKITQVFTDCAEKGIPYDEEMEIITKTGKRVWVRTIGRAMKDEKGDIIRVEGSFQDISEQKKSMEALQQIEWMLSEKGQSKEDYTPEYGDLSDLNQNGIILSLVGKEQLKDIASEYLDLLETSSAIYELNGDYALGLFSSGWCKLMDTASRRLCNTEDNRVALESGKWHCHESCWREASLEAIRKGDIVDIECKGGIRLYTVPVRAGGKIIGAINFGYGDPPEDETKLQELSQLYKIPVAELREKAREYQTRPQYIIDFAKKRIQVSAVHLGNMIERKQAEQALKEYTRKLEQAEEAANLGSWEYNVLDGSGWWSKQMFHMLGFASRDEVPSFEEYLTHVHPEDREAVSKVLRNIAKGEVTVLEEYRSNPEFGPLRYFGTSAQNIKDESGKTVKIVGSILDITELKMAEESLRESEERYRLVLDKSLDAILLTKPDGTILSANKAACEMFGMTEEEIRTTGRDGLVEREDPRLPELLEKRKRTGSTKGELTMIRRDGSRFPGEISSSVFTTSKGESRTSMIIRDITERKQAEQVLKESRRKLKTLMDNLQGMVYSCLNDKDWTMKFVSEGALPLTGYSPEELTNNRELAYNDIIHPDDRDIVWNVIQKAVAKGEPYVLEYRIITKEGSPKWVWERGRGVFSADGELLTLEGIISDISDFKEAQEKISQLRDNLETEVAAKTRELQQRVAELERFHDATIERELRMKELRDEIERLKGEKK